MNLINRRHAVACALGGLATAAGRAASGERPNIVVLFTDDQRFDTVAALGNREVQTPNMDRLVRSGVTFTHAFTQGGPHGAICMPSRAALMTGRSVFHASRDAVIPPAPVQLDTFPQTLGSKGYETFISGKWHNGPRMLAKSFNTGANIFFGGMSDQFKIALQDFDPTGAYPVSRAKVREGEFASTIFANSAIEFLKSRKRDQPFLLYLPFTSPHDPRTAPERFHKLYHWTKVKTPPNFAPQHPFDNGDLKVRDELLCSHPRVADDVRVHIAEYYAMITAVDHEIGRILDALESTGQARNTYVVFAGDNGLAVGQHGLMGKQNLYDHSWRVPLVITGPGVPRGKRVSALVNIMDVAATVCDLSGAGSLPGIEGQSLRPLWTGEKRALRDHVFATYSRFQRAVRTDRWKLIEYNVQGTRTTQLFDLKSDPWEMKNLAGDSAHAQRVTELRTVLAGAMKAAADPATLDAKDWPAT